MITTSIACIAYITILLFCIGAESMPSFLLPDLPDVQGNFTWLT